MARSFVQDTSSPNRPGILLSHAIPALPPEEGYVLVQFLAAPVNRVDAMVLSGQYPMKPRYSVDDRPVPGFDGCGAVVESMSPRFVRGDLVLPRTLGLGTWRTHAVLRDAELMKLPPATRALDAALLRSGALVAWLLLEQAIAAPVASGDCVLMSAGTSCVAQYFVQLARLRAVKAVLVIRDRGEEAVAEAKAKLLGLGAAAVMTETDLARNGSSSSSSSGRDGGGVDASYIPCRVVLAIDSVFGIVGQHMADVLAPGGKYILVGMLAGQEASISISTKHLFYKQLSFLPFRSSEILKRMGDEKVEQLVATIMSLFADGTLKTPEVHVVSWNQHGKEKLEDALYQSIDMIANGQIGYKKTVWIFDN